MAEAFRNLTETSPLCGLGPRGAGARSAEEEKEGAKAFQMGGGLINGPHKSAQVAAQVGSQVLF